MAWVQELFPKSKHYGDDYDSFGLFGGENCPTIMAHCVLSSDDEIRLMKERGVFIAHCPESNTNLASGIAPARRYLTEGIPMGLGSDIAGGTRCSIFFAMAEAIRVSKLRDVYKRQVEYSTAKNTIGGRKSLSSSQYTLLGVFYESVIR